MVKNNKQQKKQMCAECQEMVEFYRLLLYNRKQQKQVRRTTKRKAVSMISTKSSLGYLHGDKTKHRTAGPNEQTWDFACLGRRS